MFFAIEEEKHSHKYYNLYEKWQKLKNKWQTSLLPIIWNQFSYQPINISSPKSVKTSSCLENQCVFSFSTNDKKINRQWKLWLNRKESPQKWGNDFLYFDYFSIYFVASMLLKFNKKQINCRNMKKGISWWAGEF